MSPKKRAKLKKKSKVSREVYLHHTSSRGEMTIVGPLEAIEHADPELGRRVLVAMDANSNPHVFVEVSHEKDEPKDIWWSPVYQTWVRITELPGGVYHDC